MRDCDEEGAVFSEPQSTSTHQPRVELELCEVTGRDLGVDLAGTGRAGGERQPENSAGTAK